MAKHINIFIDTNILFGDYFFQEKSKKQLFDYMKEGLVNIYMSDIVLKELRRHYQLELERKNIEIEKLKKDAGRLKFQIDIKALDVDTMLMDFDEAYLSLENRYKNFVVLTYSKDILPEIIERAIYKKPPFFMGEPKSEFKDCIIWLTYSAYAEENNLQNCFFLSANTKDFCDSRDKAKVHNELLTDSERFIVYQQPVDFIAEKAELIEKPLVEFKQYIESLEIDRDYIRQQLEDCFSEQIEQELAIAIATETDYKLYLRLDDAIGGDINTHFFDIESCDGFNVEILNQRALIFGIATITAELDLSKYNYSPDCPSSIAVSIQFNYDLSEDEQCSNLEITDIEYDYPGI